MTITTHEPDRLLGGLRPPGPPTAWEVVDYAYGSPATGGLFRLRGTGWSWFCKVLQHVRHWPGLSQMPADVAAEFSATFPWRSELELWDEVYASRMPQGFRPPELHGVVDLGDDRLAVWMEDVPLAAPSCELDLFERAARHLGRWNARCSEPEALAACDLPPGYGLRMYAERAVAFRGLAPLADDALWSHPWLVGHGDLRTDLRALGPQIPAMLDRLDGYVQAVPHGDASPQNLLVPIDAPETFVVIDPSFRSPHALGFDLGQLLVGLTHAGQVPAAMLPDIAARIVPAYLAGLSDEGVTGLDDEVRDGFATSVMLRSGFDGLLLETLGSETDGARHAFDQRLVMTRFLVDQYAATRSALVQEPL
jgi:hypothetical protein